MTTNSKDDKPLRDFMRKNPTIDDSAMQLCRFENDYGIQHCLRVACEELRAGLAQHLIYAGADCHEEVEIPSKTIDVKARMGSLVDLVLHVAPKHPNQSPEPLLELLLSRGVQAAADCDHPTVVRFQTALNPGAAFSQATMQTDVIGMVKEFGAKAGAIASQGLGFIGLYMSINDMK